MAADLIMPTVGEHAPAPAHRYGHAISSQQQQYQQQQYQQQQQQYQQYQQYQQQQYQQQQYQQQQYQQQYQQQQQQHYFQQQHQQQQHQQQQRQQQQLQQQLQRQQEQQHQHQQQQLQQQQQQQQQQPRLGHLRTQSFQVPRTNYAQQHRIAPPHSQQVSPLSTSGENSPAASAPPSPKSYQGRQNRPAYMPAVLRPNSEFLAEGKPLTRAKTVGNDDDEAAADGKHGRRMSGSGLMGMLGQRMTTTRRAVDGGKSFEGEWDLQLFPQVTDLPTRKHWKPDPESTVCDDPSCKRSFNYFIRRHHCRCCGNIFCDWHSSYAMPLDQDANFNPRAPVPSRTCAHCFKQHEQTWQQKHPRAHSTSSASSSNRSSETKSGATSPLTPVGMPVGARNIIPGAQTPNVAKTPEVAASVPSDWNWSTF